MAKENVIYPELPDHHPGPSIQVKIEGNPIPVGDPSKLSKLSCSHSESGRNLVVCIDGTANQFGVNVSMSFDSSYVLWFTGDL